MKMIACACAVAAALSAAGEQGGLTFDFEAISAKRFAGAFDPRRNVLTERFEGVVTNTVRLTLPLPSTNGGTWRVSARYRMRRMSPDVNPVFFSLSPGPARPLTIPECGSRWGELSSVSEVKPGTKSIAVLFEPDRASGVELEYKDVSLVDETPRSPVVFRVMPMGNLDGRFAVAEGSCGMIEYFWRKTVPERLSCRNIMFSLELPPGMEFVDSSCAVKDSARTERRADGCSVTTFAVRNEPGARFEFDGNPMRMVLKATGRPGDCGKLRLAMRYDDRKDAKKSFQVAADDIDLFIVPARKARKPIRYRNGIQSGIFLEGLGDAAVEGILRMITDAGVTWIAPSTTRRNYDLWRSLGVRVITPSSSLFRNGFMIGDPYTIPECDRFVAAGVDEKSPRTFRVTHAACPVSVYEGSDFFRTNTVPRIRKSLKGADGCCSNWEPYMFKGKGCMCMKCCRAFAKYVGRPCEEIAAKWPKCVMKGGEYFSAVEKFRSLEHAKVVKTLDRIVREETGGESSYGMIPEIAWIEMGSWWRPRNYAAEVQAIDYAGAIRWMEPWGPYAAWESDYPYVYAKRKPLCHFVAAQDVRRTVDSDYPAGSRPRLLALPQGYQCGHWVTQPEHVSMAMDSYFFNRWEATMMYFFPHGYDARYWNAFADATDRAARFEDFVLDGRRTDSETSVAPFPGVYASPSRFLSGYLPDYRDVSPLQCVSYDLGGSRIAAVFNFWQKGEAFFTLRAKGLRPGKYEVVMESGALRVPDASRAGYSADELAAGVRLSVPAARTRVFTIRPLGPGKAAASVETDASFDARFDAARPRLEREAAEDAEYEKANGQPVIDPMPVI